MTPVGGGVSIQPLKAVSEEKIKFDDKGKIKTVSETIKTDHLEDSQWWWD